MLRIVEDTYKEGTHDLQRGTCNALRWKELERRGPEVDGKMEKLPQTIIRPSNVAHVDLKGEILPRWW